MEKNKWETVRTHLRYLSTSRSLPVAHARRRGAAGKQDQKKGEGNLLKTENTIIVRYRIVPAVVTTTLVRKQNGPALWSYCMLHRLHWETKKTGSHQLQAPHLQEHLLGGFQARLLNFKNNKGGWRKSWQRTIVEEGNGTMAIKKQAQFTMRQRTQTHYPLHTDHTTFNTQYTLIPGTIGVVPGHIIKF
jgi:hypothetical protein